MDNAVKFSPNGGDIHVSLSQDGNNLVVEIKDGGVGIPQEDLPHVFDRFFRLETIDGHLFGGLGLGLSIAKHVVEKHRGTIKVSSVIGVGSAFTVSLPA